jgi:hypothetical protein
MRTRWRKQRMRIRMMRSDLVLAVHRQTPTRAPIPDDSGESVPEGEEVGFGPRLLQVALFVAATAAATAATAFCFLVGEDRVGGRRWWCSHRWFW